MFNQAWAARESCVTSLAVRPISGSRCVRQLRLGRPLEAQKLYRLFIELKWRAKYSEEPPDKGSKRVVLKTLHLTNAWHDASGGIATFYRALIEAANRRGWPIRLVVPGPAARMEQVGSFARIYSVRSPRAPFDPRYGVIPPDRYLSPRGAVRRILLAEQPDLVEICDKYTLPFLGGLLRFGRLSGSSQRPAVVALSCERMDDSVAAYVTRRRIGTVFARWFMRWVYFPQFDRHIAVSPYVAAELVLAVRGHKGLDGVLVRPMGVDAALFSPRRRSAAHRRKLLASIGAEEGTALLLYAGRLAPEKNLTLLGDVLGELRRRIQPEFRLLVAGEGPLRQSLEQECAERFPRLVRFLGHIADRVALADLYANTDVFVHPNAREPFGIAPLEAMASGVPLVAPASGGLTSYANRTNAWLCRPAGQAFAAAICEALEDEALRRRKLTAARATAEQYSWPHVADSFLDLYAQIHARLAGPRFGGTPTPAPRPEGLGRL